MIQLAIKVDVDTERGTRFGVERLLTLFQELNISATFLFSLGPDHTGRAIVRIFRSGFLKKTMRTNALSTYGLRTLLNGILLPGPQIAKKHANLLRKVEASGHEVGIHCYDHVYWQDHVQQMARSEVFCEFYKALDEFKRVFMRDAKSAGAAGWQANQYSFAAYDAARLNYGSDTRGSHPCFPKVEDQIFNTLQIPTNLPALDELLGQPSYALNHLTHHYLNLLKDDPVNILTIHAELEGMRYLDWFRDFLICAKKQNVQFLTLQQVADQTLAQPDGIPIGQLRQGTVSGRSGTLTILDVAP
jgi:undecaprenyl phosphate-alpha-L-ara4FN deformylase